MLASFFVFKGASTCRRRITGQRRCLVRKLAPAREKPSTTQPEITYLSKSRTKYNTYLLTYRIALLSVEGRRRRLKDARALLSLRSKQQHSPQIIPQRSKFGRDPRRPTERDPQSETHTDRHTHTHRHTDTHTHIHTYRHTHTHAHIQTHTHTCAQASPALRPPSPLWQRGVGKMSGPRRGYVPASDAMQVALVVSSQYERHSDVVSHTGPGFC